ncbi:GTPase Era [bacterium BMS3Abin05]|nr:GTPase Era [bacterium BMS3Abin05]GBE28179.1 GTPase Era [bacterium BMS3Bbin03]HDL78341.1 GTPase Era [Bacteroidota bacterium]HDZ10850.1 GTPase Era [Bacteroidota bacterium]
MQFSDKFKSGYVALVGQPNVGKSTLLNALLGTKLAIISPKPQTTRHRILGVLTGEDYQIVFLDTPGLIKPQYELQSVMVKAARVAITDADVIVLMTEAGKSPAEADLEILEQLKSTGKPILLAINKIDLIYKDLLLPLIDAYSQIHEFLDIIPISALELDGLDELKRSLREALPEHPPYYPEDYLTEHSERFFVSEIIREKIFYLYGEEIPYSTTVEIVEFKEKTGKKDYIQAAIYVERDSQRAMLIGKKGLALKRVGQLAREEIEQLLNRPVYLDLWVKVREKWRRDPAAVKHFGYSTNLPK